MKRVKLDDDSITKRLPIRALGILLTSTILLCVARASQPPLVKVSQDPYTEPQTQHATEVEPVMVSHDDTIVTAFQVGRDFNGGSDNIGWATSSDRGKTWKHGFLNKTTAVVGGPWFRVTLPTIAYDRKHKMFLISFEPYDYTVNGGEGVLISRSSDGVHWSDPITAASSSGMDTHWLACDNGQESAFYGTCYEAYLDYSSPIGNFDLLVTSNDGGLTWGSPVASPDATGSVVSSLAIQRNGTAVILGRNGGPNGDQTYAIRSTDGGHSLQPTVDITTEQFMYPYLRADPNPASAVDSHGKIYVVFADCRFRANCFDAGCRFDGSSPFCSPNDLLLTTSKDAVHWTAPKRIPIDALTSNTDHLIPGLAISDDEEGNEDRSRNHAKLTLTYYFISNANLSNGSTCDSTNCLVNAGYIASDDGGNSWHQPTRIAGPILQSWLVQTAAGEMVADYLVPTLVDGDPFGAFAIARPPNATTGQFDEAIYAVKLPQDRE